MAEEEIYVIRGLHKPLLGRPAIESLDILARIGTVIGSVCQSVIKKIFFSFIQGSGKNRWRLRNPSQRRARPFSLSTPRQVPIPLMKPVKTWGDIASHGANGVVCRNGSSCQKKRLSTGMCDLTHLHPSVKRKRHSTTLSRTSPSPVDQGYFRIWTLTQASDIFH